MKNKVKKEKYFLLISLCLILCLYLLMLCGCKAKYSVEVLKESEPGIQASLEIPIYEGYEEFSDYVRIQLLNDYKKYIEIR